MPGITDRYSRRMGRPLHPFVAGFQRSLELEGELHAYLGNPRNGDLAKTALAIAKTRLVTFEGKPETLAAVERWAKYEDDPGRLEQARGIIEALNQK